MDNPAEPDQHFGKSLLASSDTTGTGEEFGRAVKSTKEAEKRIS